MDEQQKRDFDEVLKKYKRSKSELAKSYFRKVRTGAILGIGLDLVFTAGFGTVAVATAAALPTLKAAFRAAANPALRSKRQQKISASPDVVLILAEIELKLLADYKTATKAAPKNATEEQLNAAIVTRQNFLQKAEELEQDVNKLIPALKIKNGGENGYGTDKLEIIVRKENLSRSKDMFDYITLTEARKTVRDDIDKLKQQRDDLHARNEAAAEQSRLQEARDKKAKKGFRL